MSPITTRFSSKLFKYPGKGGWTFATVPKRHAPPVMHGWGRSSVIATVDGHAPGFAKSVIGRQIHSPLDLEWRFGLIGGDIFHGKMGLDQLFSARPMLGHADYRMPLSGLYLCGSGAHPGGGVTGAPGHNAAQAILRDHRSLFGSRG